MYRDRGLFADVNTYSISPVFWSNCQYFIHDHLCGYSTFEALISEVQADTDRL
jgi:hypothetical protein